VNAASWAGVAVDGLTRRLYEAAMADDPGRWAALGPVGRRDLLLAAARRCDPLLSDDAVHRAVACALDDLGGLGPLEPLLADPAVTEVMVNGGGGVWVERAGRVERRALSLDEATVMHLIERIVAPLGRRVDRSSPLVDARLPDGSRVNAIVRPVAVDGPCLTIRRFGVTAIGLDRFAPAEVVELLRSAVVARLNIVVSGGTGAGKTTLLNALAACIPAHERLITIEDTAELRLGAPHVVRLEARPANAEGLGELRVRDLVRNALRMRPDRLIVGEVRGGEALDMLQAMNTGHEGSLSTCHANSPTDALRRIETMALMSSVDLPLAAVREQVQSSVDLVVQVGREPGGGRRVCAVDEVDPPTGAGPAGPLSTSPLVRDGRVVAAPVPRPRRAGRAGIGPGPGPHGTDGRGGRRS
jgi:pilus assembly protein CpaF